MFSLYRAAIQKREAQEPQAPARVRDRVPTSLSLLAAALVGAAHALVALAGVTVAVCADVDAAQFAAVLRVVVAAGRNGTVDRLVFHDAIPPCWFVSQSLAA